MAAWWLDRNKCIAQKSEGKPRLEICPAVVQSYKTGGTTTPCRHIAQWPVFQEIILKLPKISRVCFCQIWSTVFLKASNVYGVPFPWRTCTEELSFEHTYKGSLNYSKVATTSQSCLEAHASLFSLSMKGKFDVHLLWPFGKKWLYSIHNVWFPWFESNKYSWNGNFNSTISTPPGCQKIHKNILQINLMSYCPKN